MQFAETWQARSLKNVVLSAGAPTQVVSALKIAHGFISAQNFHAGKFSVNFWSCTVLPSCKLKRKKVHNVLL